MSSERGVLALVSVYSSFTFFIVAGLQQTTTHPDTSDELEEQSADLLQVCPGACVWGAGGAQCVHESSVKTVCRFRNSTGV